MHTRFTPKAKLAAVAVAATMMIAPAAALASSQATATPSAPASALGTVNWQITLKPGPAYPTASGSAQYQSQPGQSEFQVEVEHIKSLAGKYVQIAVNGTTIGQAKVSTLGIAQFDRNSELGQKVPNIVHGSTVGVRTSLGALVAFGQF
jgi:hypothetical protein